MQLEANQRDLSSLKASSVELDGQLEILHKEYTLAKAQMDEKWMDEKWNNLQEARSKQAAVSNELRRLQDLKDTSWKARCAAQEELQFANQPDGKIAVCKRRRRRKRPGAVLRCQTLLSVTPRTTLKLFIPAGLHQG
jgi:chromosome segregation ATPase